MENTAKLYVIKAKANVELSMLILSLLLTDKLYYWIEEISIKLYRGTTDSYNYAKIVLLKVY